MSENSNPQKNYPLATPQVAQMLGIQQNAEVADTGSVSAGDLPVANLPIVSSDLPKDNHSQPSPSTPANNTGVQKAPSNIDRELAEDVAAAKKSPGLYALKTAAPYLIVFVIGVFLYIFFFSSVDFSSFFQGQPASAQSPQETLLQQLEQQDGKSYYAWIDSYYYDVSNAQITDPNMDNSGNGLTNFEKYLLNLNPKSYDTLGLGRSDTETLAMGINPLTGDALTPAQQQLIAKYIDLEAAMNRLTLEHMQNPNLPSDPSSTPTVQPANSIRGPQSSASPASPSVSSPAPADPPQGDTQVNLGNSSNAISSADDSGAISINTSVEGKLDIPSLKIDAPIIWSQSPDSFDTDLQSGVIHYPGTAMPGQMGTTYIAGHSSNYVWAKGDYNHIFTHLNQLAVDDSFSITVTQKSGRTATLNYVVIAQKQFSPTDQAQFQNQARSIVALSTCWPVNSTAKRLVVFAQLTQIVQN